MLDPRFRIVLLQRLPSEVRGESESVIAAEKAYISERFVPLSNEDLARLLQSDSEARDLFMEIGSDQIILSYSVNFVTSSGKINDDITLCNALNDKVFELCSITGPTRSAKDLNRIKVIVTSSSFDPTNYGQPFVDHYARRLGLKPEDGRSIDFLISTTMNPWATITPDGFDFLEVATEALRSAVIEALDTVAPSRHD